VNATLAARVTSKGDRRTYLRVRVVAQDGVLVANPKAAQGSGVSTSMTGANGLLVMEAGRASAQAGEALAAVLIGPIASA
jgi:molybdopterin biosynthesis enzyme